VRQTLFDVLAAVVPGSRFLDVFAGSGGVGLEALARGAERVVFVDQARGAVRAIEENLAAMGALARAEVVAKDARSALARLAADGARFDVVFVDPPYESELYAPALRAAGELLAEGGVAVAEHFHKRELPERIGGLVRYRSVRVGDHRLGFYRLEER
jgi:16S rRNA (guanine(966)-N(2))-methyltransferase RsmD